MKTNMRGYSATKKTGCKIRKKGSRILAGKFLAAWWPFYWGLARQFARSAPKKRVPRDGFTKEFPEAGSSANKVFPSYQCVV